MLETILEAKNSKIFKEALLEKLSYGLERRENIKKMFCELSFFKKRF